MTNILILFLTISFFFIIYYIICICIISKLENFKQGNYSNKVNLLYDDYYLNSKNKSNRKLHKNLGIIREKKYKSEYDFDIKILDIDEKLDYKILIINSYDIDFDITLSSKYKNVEIVSTCDNILETRNNKKMLGEENDKIFISYLNLDDIYNKLKDLDYKFDRIILRENLGNIKDRKKFLKNIKKLLNTNHKNSFIFIKTFVFQPVFTIEEFSNEKNIYYNHIFNKQKKIIDYWNYNFSTSQYIINDLVDLDFSDIMFSNIPILYILFISTLKDILYILKLYFYYMNMDVESLHQWDSITNIDILYIKAR